MLAWQPGLLARLEPAVISIFLILGGLGVLESHRIAPMCMSTGEALTTGMAMALGKVMAKSIT